MAGKTIETGKTGAVLSAWIGGERNKARIARNNAVDRATVAKILFRAGLTGGEKAAAPPPIPAPAPRLPLAASRGGVHESPILYGKTLVAGDFHFPYHNPDAVEVVLRFAEDWRPDLFVIHGDLYDGYLISRFAKEPGRLSTDHLQHEFDAARPTVERIDRIGCEVVFILGNHEARIDAVKADNPALNRLAALEWHSMAGIPARWTILPQHSRLRIGHVDYHHGDLLQGPGGKHVACNMLGKLKRSSVHGHFHRDQVYSEPDGDGILRATFAGGHLCDTEQAAKYCKLNNWADGFRSVDMDTTDGIYEVRSHLIHGGRARINGKTYGG